MNTEAQRIAIAEACGWKKESNGIRSLPDYLNDLNAMHEAEKVLSKDDWDDKFYHWIGFVVSGGREAQLWEYRKLVVHASAAQRAEAFLRTIGKWKD